MYLCIVKTNEKQTFKKNKIMKTVEERLIAIAETSKNVNECISRASEVADEVLKTEWGLFSAEKSWVSYGTWKVTLFANKYHFGKELAEELKKISVITHDEDKEFSVEDLSDEIHETIENFCYERF